MVSFILSTTFSVTEIPPRRDSAKYQKLYLYSQFSFTKSIAGNNIHSVLEECLKAILKMFLIDVNRLTLPKRLQDVIFCAYFSKCKFYIVVFSILTIGRHINM